ncbi:hypothetical protein COT62_03060 [Candidatus Roizmanbacteria bacterium CG09_land_8_20_14_0_10_41_9]|uniref:Methyltransferase type 11 domain-containing protein n=1 Tax=Candidatus Roizmanbacteria bacterium CG09_land_8_20_14_0_10_41_9 TaxID=1974850 RepID=A0A2H0WSB0_9BACT|nr:MAG: hypothetical protein COT62_03060 [Candidatus Roizmanbacteria bacterium CG09_land_8_20_14_0_10_41_9]
MTETERIFFWNRHWAERNFYNLRAHNSLILSSKKVLGGFPERNILEVGSGRAVDSIEMARRGANCIAVDFSETSFGLSQDIARNSGVKIIQCLANAEQLPFTDGCFNLVFSQGLMEHPTLMKKLLPEQIRVTRPGGFVLIDVPQFFSIQAMIKWIELKLEKWPYGPEVNFTERELKRITGSLGLEYTTSYGREFAPMVHLGIRTALSRIRHRGSPPELKNPILEHLPTNMGLITRLELSFIGSMVLNNIGIIAQKSKA